MQNNQINSENASTDPRTEHRTTISDLPSSSGAAFLAASAFRTYSISQEAIRSRQRRETETEDQRTKRLKQQAEASRGTRVRLGASTVVASTSFSTDSVDVSYVPDLGQASFVTTSSRQLLNTAPSGLLTMAASAETLPWALCPISREQDVPSFTLGAMDSVCFFCKALHFKDERPRDGNFFNCCNKGRVRLSPAGDNFPPLLRDLFSGVHQHSQNFLNNTRQYNNALAFAAMGCKQAEIGRTFGPYVFVLHGQVYHRTFPLYPNNATFTPVYNQLYVVDVEQARNHRMSLKQNDMCISALMQSLDELLREINPFARAFKQMRHVVAEEQENALREGRTTEEISMTFFHDPHKDNRRYNTTSSDQIAVVFKNRDGLMPGSLEYTAHLTIPENGDRCKRIKDTSPLCDPMTYPLFFPRGTYGWHFNIPQVPRNSEGGDQEDTVRRVTMKMYYRYMLSVRRDTFNVLLMGGKLTQQFIVNSYAKVEGNDLDYFRTHQRNFRVESYSGLGDFLTARALDLGLQQAGRPIILPSSFPAGPRAINQLFYDAMALVTKFGKPHLFLTITCNPKWPEITENLFPGQKPEHRPDLTVRVFYLRLKELLVDITKRNIFGEVRAYVGVIEFQKRGLPHAHFLIILDRQDSFNTPARVNQVVTAEIPDPENLPRLHATVMRCMIHGPCGVHNPNSPCMENGRCTKEFPKDFQSETAITSVGYPIYRRRDDNRMFPTVSNVDVTVDNRWVVPYNPRLLEKYDCHINLEVCSSLSAVKYLFKYVYKGHDCVVLKFNAKQNTRGQVEAVWDEVTSFLDARYISPPEAMWRLFGNEMHFRSHTVIRLAIHLPNEQSVVFESGNEQAAFDRAATRDTTLTAWFKLNQQHQSARQYLYREIPEHFVFNEKSRTWTPRKRYNKLISRVYSVSPRDVERFHLRLILCHVKGATSFEYLRTVNGQLHSTFKSAAIALGLLADDSTLDKTILEASAYHMPVELRKLFSVICIFCQPQNPSELYNKHKDQLIEDYVRRGHPHDVAEALCLFALNQHLKVHGKVLGHFNLPAPQAGLLLEQLHQPQQNIDRATARQQADINIGLMNTGQREAFKRVLNAVENDYVSPRLFFLDGPGGTGKTFVYNALTNDLIAKGLSVTAVASTGIAATLLIDGRTYHSTFKLYPPITETTTSHIRPGSFEFQQLKASALVIWDEATMTPSHALDAVDRLLREVMACSDKPFGGKVILLGGDFRQCLPVVRHGHRVAVVQASLKSSPLWKYFAKLQLTENMRASNSSERWFPEWLLKLGDGCLTNNHRLGEEVFEIPNHMVLESGQSLTEAIFGAELSPEHEHLYAKRAILCPKNEDCLALNTKIIQRLPGEMMSYRSIDSVKEDDPDDVAKFPVEFLNTLQVSGLPPHLLNLKKGAVILLLRNLNTQEGLCNGTRLIVRSLTENLIDAEVLIGKAKGNRVFIPRMDLIPTDSDLPFTLCRHQFPVIPAFALTINKSQGQTFDKVGIYLPDVVFSHGQLYVAFSRVTSAEGVKIHVTDRPSEQGILLPQQPQKIFTKNIVYKEIFND